MSFWFDTSYGSNDANDTNGHRYILLRNAEYTLIAYTLTCNCADFKCAKSNYKLFAASCCCFSSVYFSLTQNIRHISADVIFNCRTWFEQIVIANLASLQLMIWQCYLFSISIGLFLLRILKINAVNGLVSWCELKSNEHRSLNNYNVPSGWTRIRT